MRKRMWKKKMQQLPYCWKQSDSRPVFVSVAESVAVLAIGFVWASQSVVCSADHRCDVSSALWSARMGQTWNGQKRT